MSNADLLKKYTESNYLSCDELKKIKRYKNVEEFKDIDIDIFCEELFQHRKSVSNTIGFIDKEKRNLFYNFTRETEDSINRIEEAGRDKIDNIIPEEIKDAALINSLIDEAFSSSVIEGAYSTRRRAHDMIKQDQSPRNKSEKMILNNYKALEFTMDNFDGTLSHEMIYSIWEILTEDTLEPEDICSLYRDDGVFVKNKQGDIVFEGPKANEVYGMMDNFINYFNGYDNTNPIVKACLIHYYFVYIHPFFDGNGRTSRALMHMYLIRNGYEFLKYFSISKILVDKRNKYYEAIRTCETHESDVTFFIDFYTKLLIDTIIEIRNSYLYQFSKQLIFDLMDDKNVIINERQTKVLTYFLKRTKSSIDIKDYTKKYKVATETARKDLSNLVDYGFFRKSKVSKKFLYNFNNIDVILEHLSKF